MQFIFTDPYYDTDEWEDDKYLIEVKEQLSLLYTLDTLKNINIGHGADNPGVLIDIFNGVDWKVLTGGSVTGLFLLGDKIKKNYAAWIEIIKNVSDFVTKFKPTRFDEQAAIALSLNEIIKKDYDLSNIELSLQIIPFKPGPIISDLKLEATPDTLYIITIKTYDKVYIFGIKSNGKKEFEHELSTFWGDF